MAQLDSKFWQVTPLKTFNILMYRSVKQVNVIKYPESHLENVTITLITSLGDGHLDGQLPDGYTHLQKNLHRLERSYIISRHTGVAIFKIVYEGKRPLYLFHFGKFPPGIYAGTIYHITSLEADTIFSSVLHFVETYTPGFWLWNNILKIFHIDLDFKIKQSYDIIRDLAWDFLDEATRDLFLFFLVYITSVPKLGPGLINFIVSGVLSLLLVYVV